MRLKSTTEALFNIIKTKTVYNFLFAFIKKGGDTGNA